MVWQGSSTVNMWKKILFIVKPLRRKLILLFAFFFLSSLVELLGIASVYPYLALIQDPGVLESVPVIKSFLAGMGLTAIKDILLAAGVAVLALLILKGLVYFVSQYLISYMNYDVIRFLKQRLFQSYLKAPWSFHLQNNSMKLISTVTNDVSTFSSGALQNLLVICNEILFLGFFLVTVVVFEPRLILVGLGLAAILVVFQRLSRRKTFEYGKIGSDTNAESLKVVNQGLQSVILSKIYGTAEFFLRRNNEVIKKNVKASAKFFSFMLLPRIGFEMIFFSGFILYVLVQVVSGQDLKAVFSFAGALGVASTRLLPSLSRLANSFSGLKNGEPATDKVYADLKEVEAFEKPELPVMGDAFSFKNHIEVVDLDFLYRDGKGKALDGVGFTIEKGDVVGIIGASGSGKTTLANILLGLLPPSRGDILIDGRSVLSDLRSWQNHLGYVPQQIYLLDDTVRANIAFGVDADRIDEKALARAVASANLGDVIASLPEGLETLIGENGARLSGGQRQRIGIARALYRNPDVLIFDEATSALDQETERVISEAVHLLGHEKTLIIIAHRLSTLENCRVIHKLERGRVVASGTYAQIVLGEP